MLNYGKVVKNEDQFLKLFKIDPIFRSSEVYFSLYHHLFIFLAVHTFIDAVFVYFTSQPEEVIQTIYSIRERDDQNNELFVDLIFYLIMVDGEIHKHERKIFSELRSMVFKNVYPQKRVVLHLLLKKIIESGIDPFLFKTIYKIAVITIMIDDRETERERAALEEIQNAFQISPQEHERLIMEVTTYLYSNMEIIYRSNFRKIFASLERRVLHRLQKVLLENKDNLISELTQTRDMTVLIGRWLQGEKLSKEEQEQVGHQMVDVLKTIPALGIFALPGGAVLLPLLSKILPFSILPSSFDKEKNEDRL